MDPQREGIRVILARIDERTENIEKVVLGNGKPGLQARVEALEVAQGEDRGEAKVWGYIRSGFAGLLGAFLQFLLSRKGH